MVHAIAYTVLAIFMLTWGGNWICRKIFKLTGLTDATLETPGPSHSAGRVIGILERLILAVGIVVHSWEILAAVIALKTVARFQKMDQREFAEYFLVGSLFSILWALVVTSAWSAYDHRFGINIREQVVMVLGLEPTLPAN
jgi:hypothetical protein